MASFISIPPSSPLFRRNPPSIPSNSFLSLPHLQLQSLWGRGRALSLLRTNCLSDSKNRDDKQEGEEDGHQDFRVESAPSLAPLDSYSDSSISAYKWCAWLGGLGFLETSYLTYLKLTDSDAFCPVGAEGSCGDILNSDYAFVFGVPLPLIGMLAYGVVATLGLQSSGMELPFKISKDIIRLILIGTTTSMAAASAYFLYIINSEFPGELCVYCLGSAFLSFSLFAFTIKAVGAKEISKNWGLQLCVAALVVNALSLSYNSAQPVPTSLNSFGETELPFFKTEIKTRSSPLAVALAKHLHSIGAKMYGAFWCSHCVDQKEMFGREAMKILDYVECFPNGFKKGTKIADACADVGIEGFPTWVINGQVLNGEQTFSDLAEASGIKLEDLTESR